MSVLNVYLCGVGGQGIGLLGDILCHALHAASQPFIGSETHGVAQRGGPVSSNIRIGASARTPIIPPHQAQLVIALERVEALRAADHMLAPKGTLIYVDTVLQPLSMRADNVPCPTVETILDKVNALGGECRRIHLEDPARRRLQNIAALAYVAALYPVRGLAPDDIRRIVAQRVPPHLLERNLEVFDEVLAAI